MNRSSARPFVVVVLLLAACSHGRSGAPAPRPTSGTIITADDIRRSPGMSLEQLLLARVPGLTSERAADGRTILHLRGTTTFLGDQEPLVVVNGIPLGPNASGNLNAISVQDIESIEVLRDGASTAAYGIRGANGVILIRTKQT
ncbi:MAG: TonB-dependent receptor plug domain-containing protein [Gemmatimonadales bacterium]